MIELDLVEQQTEKLFITSRENRNTYNIQADGYIIIWYPAMKYLVVMLDTKINLKENVDRCGSRCLSICGSSRKNGNMNYFVLREELFSEQRQVRR